MTLFLTPLFLLQVVSDLYRRNQFSLSASHVDILADIFSCIASHAQQLNTDTVLRRKFKRACSVQNLTEPQLLNFENEAYKSYMMFLQDMVTCNPNVSKELDLESLLVTECAKIVKIYLKCTDPQQQQQRKPVLWGSSDGIRSCRRSNGENFATCFFTRSFVLIRSRVSEKHTSFVIVEWIDQNQWLFFFFLRDH